MIHEVFIATPAHKVLYGNTTLYPESPAYPVHAMADNTLSQLRVNDVVLGVLYRNLDDFTAAKYLLDLRRLLEDKILLLDQKTVFTKYFIILELLQGLDIIHSSRESLSLSLISGDNTYIDVVETVHAVVLGDGTAIKNSIYGNIILGKTYPDSLRMVVDKGRKYFVCPKSNYEIANHLDKIEIQGRETDHNTALLTYSVNNINNTLFRLDRVGNRYTFVCRSKLKLKFVKFVIPVPRTTFSADLRCTAGHAEFDMENSQVVWRLSEHVFSSESILVEKSVLEDFVDSRPVVVHFNIPEWTESGLKVEDCSCAEAPGTRFWVRYTTQDGCYEIRP